MHQDVNKPLLILNASAGSGKTYNLVRNYLSLLLKENGSKSEIGNIIAMTFTNKASLEMKTRIIGDLDKLAFGTAPKEHDFREQTAAYVGLTAAQVQKNAQQVLKKILHQYEDFHVLTIDKFNLRLIRSFTRDLDLPENFEIVLEDSRIVELAIDELLSRVNHETKNHIYDLVVKYAKENVLEESKWNIKKALIEDGKILTNEKYFHIIDNLVEQEIDPANRAKWKAELMQSKLVVIEKLNDLKRRFHEIQPEPSQFENGMTTYKMIEKLLEFEITPRTKLSKIETSEAAIKNVRLTLENEKETLFSPLFLNFIDYLEKNKTHWFIRELQIQNFYHLAILRELALIMNEIRTRDSLIRVSEFNRLVANLVQNEDAPFIYERLGSRYKHFFLDEFQDTSRLQWLNLVPLLHNAIAQNDFNFIVGDPKQSIYRFKNGVAEQFVSLPEIYNPENSSLIAEKSNYFKVMGQVETLEENWRSAQEIVNFNNRFFTTMRDFAPEHGQKHYNSIRQIPKGKPGGYIHAELAKTERSKMENLSDPDGYVLNLLQSWVETCIQDGYAPADICILGRTKKECNRYAMHLKSIGLQVVSTDSLLLSSDPFVQLAIEFVRVKSNPGNEQFQMNFALKYIQLYSSEEVFATYKACFIKKEVEELTLDVFSLNLFLTNHHLPANLFEENYSNIYALLTHFFRAIHVDILDNTYLYQLMDFAYTFDNVKGPDLLEFLNQYNTFGHKSNVSLPETKDSIQIMTAHKSKGLEFPIVLIPSINFLSDRPHEETTIQTHEGGYYKTKLTKGNPIKTIVEMNKQESESNYMDAMNLLYVAFTRAVDRLYFSGEPKNSFTNNIIGALKASFDLEEKDDNLHLTFGEKPLLSSRKEAKNAFETTSLQDFLWFPEISIQPKKDFESEKLEEAQQIGKLFHSLMENTLDLAAAKEKLERLHRRGKISKVHLETMESLIEQAFSDSEFLNLLQAGEHLDEQTLIVSAYETLRPDKIIRASNQTIVLDFKTGEPLSKHKKQVLAYMQVLQSMDLPEVSGYLYYVGGAGLIPVN